jgi:hypothetical protein
MNPQTLSNVSLLDLQRFFTSTTSAQQQLPFLSSSYQDARVSHTQQSHGLPQSNHQLVTSSSAAGPSNLAHPSHVSISQPAPPTAARSDLTVNTQNANRENLASAVPFTNQLAYQSLFTPTGWSFESPFVPSNPNAIAPTTGNNTGVGWNGQSDQMKSKESGGSTALDDHRPVAEASEKEARAIQSTDLDSEIPQSDTTNPDEAISCWIENGSVVCGFEVK